MLILEFPSQAELWQQDFDSERHEREQAAGRRVDEQAQEHLIIQRLQGELRQYHAENQQLKEHVSSMEDVVKAQQRHHKSQQEQANQLQRAQLEELRRQLRQSNEQLDDATTKRNQLDDIYRQLREARQQLDEAITNNEKLNDDVLAKTQQVKQYKKQVDGLKTELAKYRSQMGTKSHQLPDKEQVGCTEACALSCLKSNVQASSR